MPLSHSDVSYSCWLIRVSLFIELRGAEDLGKGWRGDLGTFMISRPILHGSNRWKLIFWNGCDNMDPIIFQYAKEYEGCKGCQGV